MPTVITAIVCTHNRSEYLSKALQSLFSQTLKWDDYEILVVDNASTDNTAIQISQLAQQVSNLRYEYEPTPGLSRARNRGYLSAQGKYVAYLDDDAIAAPDWLENILKAFARLPPEAGLLGGKALPIWEAERPAWLTKQLLPYLSLLDLAEPSLRLGPNQYVVGVNMAMPRRLLEQIGGFQISLGRHGKMLLSNEELLLKQMLENLGYSTYYDSSVVVHHHIPADRLRPHWFLHRCFWQGVSDALLQLSSNPLAPFQRIRLGITQLRRLLMGHPTSLIILLRWLWPRLAPCKFVTDCYLTTQIGFLVGVVIYNSIKTKTN